MLCKGRLDLSQLDPEAANLDLVVEASKVLDLTVRAAAGSVTGAVEAPATERVRQESLSRKLLSVEITAGDACPAHEELTGNARRNGLEPRVEDVHAQIGDRLVRSG